MSFFLFSSDSRADGHALVERAPRATRAAQGLRARDGTESLCGLAWFGSVWVGLGLDSGWDCARGIFPLREHCFPGPPLNSRFELELEKRKLNLLL